MSLREQLFTPAPLGALKKRGITEIPCQSLRKIVNTIWEDVSRRGDGLLILERPLVKEQSFTRVRYGTANHKYLCLNGSEEKKPYDLFRDSLKALQKNQVPIGTSWQPFPEGSEICIPFREQLEGALLWWYDVHKYPRETTEMRLERITNEVKAIPSARPNFVSENGATYRGKVPCRRDGKPMHELFLYGVPLEEATAHRVWRKLDWMGDVTYAEILDAGQPADGNRREFFTAESVALLYKVIWQEQQQNKVPRDYSVLLRPTTKTLQFYRALRRVHVQDGEKRRPLHVFEKSILLGTLLRMNQRGPEKVFHPSHAVERVTPEDLGIDSYSSSGL